MTPERAGSLPNAVWLDLVFKEGMDEKSLRKLMVGRGGLLSLLGTSDLREVERRVEAGEARAVLIWKALCESIAAAIAGAMARFDGRRPAAILLTGGMARSKLLVDRLLLLLDPLQVPVRVYPGEFEAEALREGAVRVLRGVEQAMVYGEEAG
jgi:butyrate kinase